VKVQAEVSLYPLRCADLGAPIGALCKAIERAGLHAEMGPMSTLVSGECEAVFDGLKAALSEVAGAYEVVLVMKVSNACPSSRDDTDQSAP
jgi:uncharacterized protein YqgV (UPF0045/DUF77 family)